jgi:hypothetical protein
VLQINLVIFEVPHAFHKGRRDHLPTFLQFLDLFDLHGNLRIKAPLCIIKLLELILEITVPSSRSKVLEPELPTWSVTMAATVRVLWSVLDVKSALGNTLLHSSGRVVGDLGAMVRA